MLECAWAVGGAAGGVGGTVVVGVVGCAVVGSVRQQRWVGEGALRDEGVFWGALLEPVL